MLLAVAGCGCVEDGEALWLLKNCLTAGNALLHDVVSMPTEDAREHIGVPQSAWCCFFQCHQQISLHMSTRKASTCGGW